jgi:hypothetical protein
VEKSELSQSRGAASSGISGGFLGDFECREKCGVFVRVRGQLLEVTSSLRGVTLASVLTSGLLTSAFSPGSCPLKPGVVSGQFPCLVV